jgi:hypothetical protein
MKPGVLFTILFSIGTWGSGSVAVFCKIVGVLLCIKLSPSYCKFVLLFLPDSFFPGMGTGVVVVIKTVMIVVMELILLKLGNP